MTAFEQYLYEQGYRPYKMQVSGKKGNRVLSLTPISLKESAFFLLWWKEEPITAG